MFNPANAMAIEPGKWYISRSLRSQHEKDDAPIDIMYHFAEETVLKFPLGGPYNSRKDAERHLQIGKMSNMVYVWQCPDNAEF